MELIESSAKPPKRQVCDRCLKLNLSSFFENQELIIPIKKIDLQKSTDCVLCSILLRSTYEQKTNGQDYELRVKNYEENNIDHLILIRCTRGEIPGYLFHYFDIMDGHAFLEPATAPKFQTPSDRFNPDQTMNWISECVDHHTVICHPARRPIHTLYLIDCDDISVVIAQESYKYIALSYVWGESSNDKMQDYSKCDGEKAFLLPDCLPLVVTDAIIVTKSIGFRYLWVDKFCIAQDQPEVKHRKIAEMDAVYTNSELTIIAAAGQDETYGLPGVSNRPRVAPLMVEIGDARVLWFQNPVVSIKKSKWYTRGWTYQERFLARRRLFFLDDQTYYECGTTEHCDGIHESLSSSTLFYGGTQDKIGIWQSWGTLSDLGKYLDIILRDYTTREFRYDNDSLLALAGILRHLQALPSGLRHVWGIPWANNYNGDRSKPWPAFETFVVGLCWYHVRNCWESPGKPRRRSMIQSPISLSPTPPTWTWAGWDGQVGFDSLFLDPNVPVLRVRPLRIWLEDQYGLESTLSSVANLPLSDSFRYPILCIETWAVSPDRIHFQEMRAGLAVWYIHGHKARKVYLSEGACSEVELARNLKEPREHWRCVLLATRVFEPVVILLILRKEMDENLWMRVGIMMLEYSTPDMEELPYPAEEFRIK